jgi:hypothetical protein
VVREDIKETKMVMESSQSVESVRGGRECQAENLVEEEVEVGQQFKLGEKVKMLPSQQARWYAY